jgi:hypothetical protein
MGNRRMKHLNELRVKAMAGDRLAAAQLEAETFIPFHLRQPDPLGALHRRMGTRLKQGVHVTAKTLQAVRCLVSDRVNPDYGLDRLQMLKDRRDRRAVAA